MTRKNLGTFSLSMSYVRDKPDEVAKVFALLNFVPIHVDTLDFGNEIEYTGMSDRFRELPPGEKTPVYVVMISHSKTGFIDLIEVKEVELCRTLRI